MTHAKREVNRKLRILNHAEESGILLKRAVILASHDPCFMFGENPIANTVMKDSNARSLSPGHTPIKQRMRLLKRSYI